MTYPTLFAIAILSLITAAHSHGMLCTPRQRGAYHSTKCGNDLATPPDPVTDHCAHCLNGGTVLTVSKNLPSSGWSVYDPLNDPMTTKRAGLCGDPVGDTSHMIDGNFMPYSETPFVAHWKSGSVVNFEVEIDTNHNGYFEYFLCDLDACNSNDISSKCMANGSCYRLERVSHPDCQNPTPATYHECGPIDKNYPGRWYVPCRQTGHVGIHLVGGAKGTMQYRLPQGVTCEHCVVQWYWGTANSCAPRGFLDYFKNYDNPFGTSCDSDGGGKGAYRPGMSECSGNSIPEEFWSCADVKISQDGQGGMKPMNATAFGTGANEVIDNTDAEEIQEAPAEAEDFVPGNTCIGQNQACDGTNPCCGGRTVCVHMPMDGFVCKRLRTLWKSLVR